MARLLKTQLMASRQIIQESSLNRIVYIFIWLLVSCERASDRRDLNSSSTLPISNSKDFSSFVNDVQILDNIHRRLLTSKFRNQVGLEVSYDGLVQRKSPISGYLEGSPGVWRFSRVANGDGGAGEYFLSFGEQGKDHPIIIDKVQLWFRFVDAIEDIDLTHRYFENTRMTIPVHSEKYKGKMIIELLFDGGER